MYNYDLVMQNSNKTSRKQQAKYFSRKGEHLVNLWGGLK